MNIDPIEAIEKKIIRSDLFYRFSSGLISLPPLRERKEDIEFYIQYYTEYFSQTYNKRISGVDDEVRRLFLSYSWEGNVRELRNTIESMIASASEQELLTKKTDSGIHMMRRMEKHEPEKRRTAEIDIEELQTAAKEDKIPYYAIMEDTERELIKSLVHGCRKQVQSQ